MNTAIDYMYRDASNYKLHDRRVFPGEITAAERDAITRERFLSRWKTKAHPPGSSNVQSEPRATNDARTHEDFNDYR